MSQPPTRLDQLRREIDAIDDALLEGLARRYQLRDAIAEAKGVKAGGAVLRPGREAQVLRRLLATGAGRVPGPLLVRLWREVMGAAASRQAPRALMVCAPAKPVGYTELARNHFGAQAPMSLHRSATAVLRAVSETAGAIGVLPMPQEGEAEPWWPALVHEADREHTPTVIWRVPFLADAPPPFEDLSALAVACTAAEPSGDDVTLMVVETRADVSRGSVRDGLKARGMAAALLATHETGADTRLNLVEVAGFLTYDDARIAEARAGTAEQVTRIVLLGAYPRPYRATGGAATA